MKTCILIAGGLNDPNLKALIKKLKEQHIPYFPLLTSPQESPPVTWDLDKNQIFLHPTSQFFTAAFYRQDVFHQNGELGAYRASAWHLMVESWLAHNDAVKIFNREHLYQYTNKLSVLIEAQKVGLKIPSTIVSNELTVFQNFLCEQLVAKPVTGGGYCQNLRELIDSTDIIDQKTATPAIIQEQILGPDLRIYRIGQTFLGFKIESEQLDYRTTNEHEIVFENHLLDEIIEPLKKLTDHMGLNWCAADFKIDEYNQSPIFLEINSNPMFSAFDKISKGKLLDEILSFLLYDE